MTTKNRIVVHLFYEQEYGSMGAVRTVKIVKSVILFDVGYDDIPSTIDLIVKEFWETCSWHELKSITGVKDEIYINGKLI